MDATFNDADDNLPNEVVPANDEEATGDCSLQEENTLSACLMKILQKRDSEESNDLVNVEGNYPVFDTSDVDENVLMDEASVEAGTRPKTRQCPSSLQVNDISSESEVEKLRKWREAGVALRKALSEQSSDSLARTPSSMSSSFRAGNDDPMNLMLDDYMSGPFGPVLGDICSTTTDSVDTKRSDETSDGKNTEHQKHNKSLAKSTRPVSSQSKKHAKHVRRESDNADISQGLAEVREKIKKITSRISKNNVSPPKSQTSKASRCAFRSHRLSSKTESSSSESADEVVPKRHKYVHKAHRTRSNSRSPKTNNTPPGSFREQNNSSSHLSAKLHKPAETCKTCGGVIQECDKKKQGYNKVIPSLPKTSKDIEPNIGSHSTKPSLSSNNQRTKDDPQKIFVNKKDALIDTLASLETVESDEDLPNLITSSEDETSQRGLEEALQNIQRQCNDIADEQKTGEIIPRVSTSEEEQEDEIANKLRSLVNKVTYN